MKSQRVRHVQSSSVFTRLLSGAGAPRRGSEMTASFTVYNLPQGHLGAPPPQRTWKAALVFPVSVSARFSLQIPRRKATRAGERGIRAACARLPLEEPTGVHAHPRVGARPRLPPLLAGAGRRFPFFKSLPVLTLWVAISLSPYFKLSFFAVRSWARSPQISLPREQVVKAGARLPHVAALPLRRPPQGPLRASPCTRDFLESGLSPSPQIPFPLLPGTPAT